VRNDAWWCGLVRLQKRWRLRLRIRVRPAATAQQETQRQEADDDQRGVHELHPLFIRHRTRCGHKGCMLGFLAHSGNLSARVFSAPASSAFCRRSRRWPTPERTTSTRRLKGVQPGKRRRLPVQKTRSRSSVGEHLLGQILGVRHRPTPHRGEHLAVLLRHRHAALPHHHTYRSERVERNTGKEHPAPRLPAIRRTTSRAPRCVAATCRQITLAWPDTVACVSIFTRGWHDRQSAGSGRLRREPFAQRTVLAREPRETLLSLLPSDR
jgi:hypothetical protein